jgi:TPR repeat protein
MYSMGAEPPRGASASIGPKADTANYRRGVDSGHNQWLLARSILGVEWGRRMNRPSGIWLAGALLALMCTSPALSGPIEDAAVARHRGDLQGAEQILTPMAGRGDFRAEYALGELYADPSPQQDVSMAATWFRKAADQGYGPAQAMLGGMYAMGGGVPPDPAQAAAWFRKAAEQGDVTGETGLATCYARGVGVPQDSEKAFFWFKKAAEQRFLPGQINVGLMYQGGHGVAQDRVQALMWFDLAAGHLLPDSVQGAAIATKARDQLSAQMKPEQVEEAKRLAALWLGAHADQQTSKPGG